MGGVLGAAEGGEHGGELSVPLKPVVGAGFDVELVGDLVGGEGGFEALDGDAEGLVRAGGEEDIGSVRWVGGSDEGEGIIGGAGGGAGGAEDGAQGEGLAQAA
jgi:hypothetical protein